MQRTYTARLQRRGQAQSENGLGKSSRWFSPRTIMMLTWIYRGLILPSGHSIWPWHSYMLVTFTMYVAVMSNYLEHAVFCWKPKCYSGTCNSSGGSGMLAHTLMSSSMNYFEALNGFLEWLCYPRSIPHPVCEHAVDTIYCWLATWGLGYLLRIRIFIAKKYFE